MLAGATQRSDSDAHDQTSPGITVPPHWMIMWSFDAKATGLPTTRRDTGAYIMWSGTPYAPMHSWDGLKESNNHQTTTDPASKGHRMACKRWSS